MVLTDNRRRMLLAWLLLGAAVLVVFAQTGTFGLVNWDDGVYVGKNPHVLAGLTVDGVKYAFTSLEMGAYHPVTWLSLQLNAALFGTWYGGFHLFNVAVHLANSLILFHLLERLTGKAGRSLVVAILFAIHPAHVESVAWISERKDVLSTLFGLLAMAAYARFVATRRVCDYLLVAAAMLLSLFSKPMLVTLPALLLLMDYWPLGRVGGNPALSVAPSPNTGPNLRRLLMEKVPLLLISGAMTIGTVAAQSLAGAVPDAAQISPLQRLCTVPVNYLRYVKMYLWPMDYGPFYHQPVKSVLIGSAAALVLMAMTFSAWRMKRTHPAALAGWLFFLISALPIIGLIQTGGHTTADRYTYVPHIGLAIASVWLTADWIEARPGVARWKTALVALVALPLLVSATWQTSRWRDSVTLWSHGIRVDPSDTTCHSKLGEAYLFERQMPARALESFREALRLTPTYFESHVGAANALMALGQTREAAQHLSYAASLKPTDSAVHATLGQLLGELHDYRAASEHFQAATRLNPSDATSFYNHGLVLLRLGSVREALTRFEEASRLNPRLTSALVQAGGVFDQLGQTDAAAARYRQALALEPANAAASNGLGVVLAKRGELKAAITQFKNAVASEPGNTEAQENLERAQRLLDRPPSANP